MKFVDEWNVSVLHSLYCVFETIYYWQIPENVLSTVETYEVYISKIYISENMLYQLIDSNPTNTGYFW